LLTRFSGLRPNPV